MQKHVSALYVEIIRLWRGLQPGAKHPVCLTGINNHPITKADFIVNINLLSRGCEGIGDIIKLRYSNQNKVIFVGIFKKPNSILTS